MGYFSREYPTGVETTVINLSNGGEKWTDIDFSISLDSSFAYCKAAGTYSEYLDIRGLDKYGTPWAANTVVTGVGVEVYGYSDGGADNHEIYSVYLAIDGVQEGDDIGPTGVYLPELDSIGWTAVGGDGVMWGLTSDQIKAYTLNKKIGFLVDFNDSGGLGGSCYVDDVRVIIYYDVFKTHSLLGVGL